MKLSEVKTIMHSWLDKFILGLYGKKIDSIDSSHPEILIIKFRSGGTITLTVNHKEDF